MASGSSRLAVFAGIGVVAVLAGAGALAWVLTHRAPPPPPPPPPEPHFATKVARGEWLFHHFGCPACHGEAGRGGVANANYIRDTVPALNLMAGRMMIIQKSDADTVVAMLEHGEDPHAAAAHPPFEQYGVFLAQWDATRALIQNGNPAGKKDPNGPAPPLNMPSWRGQVTDEDMTDILAYLFTLEPWDSDGYAPEEPDTSGAAPADAPAAAP